MRLVPRLRAGHRGHWLTVVMVGLLGVSLLVLAGGVLHASSGRLDGSPVVVVGDASTLGSNHRDGHALGWHELEEAGDVAKAFAQCDASDNTGCYHGVLQAYFSALPHFSAETVEHFCAGQPIATSLPILRFHCVHGVGHGLAVYFDGGVDTPLAACDRFVADEDREGCYGGVFMQRGERERQPGRSPLVLPTTPQDPLASCRALAVRYQRACVEEAAVALLDAVDADLPAAFAACDALPAGVVVPCYQGVGATLAAMGPWDPAQTSAWCQEAHTPYRPWCIDGAISLLTSTPATSDRAFALCRVASTDVRIFCFETLGERLPGLFADAPAQAAACALAQEATWIGICRRSAGLDN